MKITYLRLKNYAGIFAAMKKKDVEYQFSKMKNRIVLLIGGNGSGKTTILSTLHPFAYPGSMDIRNGSGLILSGEQGMKEIHYDKDGQEIKIKHVYTPTTTGHSVKSFISIDGEEKNPNGNVTSFVTMVETFLDIEQDYLKLTRLGANVTGLINMKSTERKGFTSSMLADVDVYTGFYKKINSDTRELKTLLKSLSDKLAKLNIKDVEMEIKEITSMKNKLSELEELRERKNTSLGIISYRINELSPKDSTFKELLTSLNKEYSNCTHMLNRIEKELSTIIITDNKEEVEKAFKKVYEAKLILSEKINQTIESIDKCFKKKQDYDIQLMHMNDSESLESLNSTRNKLKTKIDSIKNLPKINVTISKSELLTLLSLAQEVERVLGNLSAFDDEMILSTYSMIKDNRNIDNYVYSNVNKIDMKLAKIDRELIEYSDMQKTDTDITVLYELYDNCSKCPYYQMSKKKDVNKAMTSANALKMQKMSLLKKREEYLSINLIRDYILGVIKSISSYETIIKQLSYNPFTINSILRTKNIDTTYISDAIEYCELQEELSSLTLDLYKIESEISNISSTESIKSITMLSDEVTKELTELETKLTVMTNEKVELDDTTNRLENILSIITRNDQLIKDKEVYSTRKQELDEAINSMKQKEEEVSQLKSSAVDIQIEINTYTKNIKAIQEYLQTKQYNLQQYEELTEESNVLNDKYEELSILREALSSNKGIPLLFIQLYLKNTRILANKLLQNVFEGDLEISEFIINEKEFKIPYTRHGIEVSDVVYASQGESSFLSIALSFALMQQSLKSYNVMLLDEIDATLDQSNRNTFISILEQQLEEIGCEQVFMITHNNVFDNYPVDILRTSNTEIDNYKNIGTILE